jgi:cobalamin biosynthetic protein CobC
MSDGNTNNALGQHGGNLSAIAAAYPGAPQPFIDLSTGINPYAYPLGDADAAWLHCLPDAAAMLAARQAAARYYGSAAEHTLLAAGMQPLIFALACLRFKECGASRVHIVSPTYGEHRRVWDMAGHGVVETPLADADCDVLVVCNPNNPDGRLMTPEALAQLADRLAVRGGWLVVDESFADSAGQSVVPLRRDNMAVLRSCGKFFGVAGLRASAVIAPAGWTAWLDAAIGPWPVSTAACHQLPAMFGDAAWIAAMKLRLQEEAARWREILSAHFSLIGHTPLFTLVQSEDAESWHRYLMSQGILTRRFDDAPHRLRIGLPDSNALPRLCAVLKKGIQR